jgi:non-specific serine/threonine protein kinase/serine/threonine-protein kinase
MNSERWSRLRGLFSEVEARPQAERAELIERETAGDPELREELERLLSANDSATGFLVGPGSAPPHEDPADPATSVALGAVGPYRLLQVLGEGGFGVVYLARQERPIRRHVALKLVKPGMDTRQVIARFEAERQALALMDHPGIAQVFEAGATDTGRPYFAMEYVPGVPVTAFCDGERLGVRPRLELFLLICDAVQHAHQKGVIHRDLKPSNVLVAMRDGVPAPKVIDFGIVKAASEPAGATLMTREGMIVGTLGYMSPEQAGASDAVDTRSDIYSLGVLLYELLTGQPPFDSDRLRKAALSDAVRVIREEEPPPLATRVARSGEDHVATIARSRSADPRRLMRELRGELQWITMRALEKEPDRRYASAAELAADVRRHLADEPVLAGPPSTMYRVRKYARRHRVGVTAAAVVLLTAAAGVVATGIGFRRAVRAEIAARREAESSKEVAKFLVGMFRASSPDRSQGEVLTARQLLDDGTKRIESGLRRDPLVRASVLDAMGTSYLNLGDYDEGIRLTREALGAAESAVPHNEVEIARRRFGLAQAFSMAAQPDSALVLVNQALADLDPSGETNLDVLARCLLLKGSCLNDQGEGHAADSLVTRALALTESSPHPDGSLLMRLHATKANIAHRAMDLEVAERHYSRELELSEEVDEPTWSVHAHRRLASVYRSLRDDAKALTHAEEGVRLARKIYAPDHPNLADALGGLADALVGQERLEEAIAVHEEALQVGRGRGTPEGVAHQLNWLGILYRATGRLDLATARAEEAVQMRRDSAGPESARTAEAMSNLARCYVDAGRTREADSTFLAALAIFDKLRADNIFAVETAMYYADLCRDTDRADRADSFYVRAEAALDSTKAAMRPFLGYCLTGHGYLRATQGRHDEAERMLAAGVALARGDEPEESAAVAEHHVLWAAARARAGDLDGAAEQLARAARSGATEADAARRPELAPLASRPDYPFRGSP